MTTQDRLQSILIPIVLAIGLLLFILRSVLFHLNSAILDGVDYPLYAWILQSGQENIRSLFSNGFFFANAFYPDRFALLFSDTFYPLSFLLLPLSFFSASPLLTVNLALLLTLSLGCVSSAVLARRLISDPLSRIVCTLFLSFSPYVFTQTAHLQMLSYWPTYLILALLIRPIKKHNIIFIGLLLSIQWYLSVYLGFMAVGLITIFWSIQWLAKRNTKEQIINAGKLGFMFLILTGPLLLSYLHVQRQYAREIHPGMFVDYAAQPSDYLFIRENPTLLSMLPPFTFWNSLNQHGIGEPARWIGGSLGFLAVVGLIAWIRKRTKEENQLGWIAIVCIGLGFVFSLGTRLTLNGWYTAFPLPYLVVLKIFPFLSFFRSPSRWYFVFVFGVVLFTVLGLKRIQRHMYGALLSIAFMGLYILEMVPLTIPTQHMSSPSYREALESNCRGGDVLAALPIFSYTDEARIALDPSSTSQLMMWARDTQCRVWNGYSGVIPMRLTDLDTQTRSATPTQLVAILRSENIALVLVDKNKTSSLSGLAAEPGVQWVFENDFYTLWRIQQN